MPRMPASVRRFCKDVMPLLHKRTKGSTILQDVEAIVETDRWNSFDRFRETTRTLVDRYREAGVEAEVHTMPTGGRIGSGRWIIQEAADVVSATVDVLRPTRRRILDFSDNPWHVVQWSAATPRGGVTGELVTIDSKEALEGVKTGGLAGKILLTKLDIRGLLAEFGDKGVAAVITDHPVDRLPDATPWTKFGWGGKPIGNAARHTVGLVLSEREGARLRRTQARSGPVSLRVKVDIRKYAGSHDQVSGLVRGADDPQDEVWVLAHSSEPGAIDNASGVALCLEIARVLEGLIAEGRLARPRRTIRLMNAYECYGFFKYLEDTRRMQTPLAGVVIDTIGSRPEVCDGRLEWHATIPMSAGFVNQLGAWLIGASLKLGNPGYRLCREPFMPTSDTLIGDPKYGFPCPWITTHHRQTGRGFDAYHTSADTVGLLSSKGLASCATSMAGYLYYLANAGSREAVELARAETAQTVSALSGLRRGVSPSRVRYALDQHEENLTKLQRWLWEGRREDILKALDGCRDQARAAADRLVGARRSVGRKAGPGADVIPRRTAVLSPSTENVPVDISRRIRKGGFSSWALFWADGNRTLPEIADALSVETGKDVDPGDLLTHFEAHADLGYVSLHRRGEACTRSRLVDDLKALGLSSGMDVMVHSSLSSIGHVLGGAQTVVDAILLAVGRRGTVVMPSFNHTWAAVYNRMATPTINGEIPDCFWRRRDAVRSDHPSHAVAAIGPKAGAICEGHVAAGLWTQDGPIGRLIKGGGYILSIGVDHTSSTAYHVGEMSVPCGCLDPFGSRDRVVAADGSVQVVPGLGWRSEMCPVPLSKLQDALNRKRTVSRGKVGSADALLVPAREVWATRRRHLKPVCSKCRIRPEERKR
jgi:aminoglycoside 3-N-acetyltransferase